MNRSARLLTLACALGCAKTPLGVSPSPDAAPPADAGAEAPPRASNGVPIPDVPAHATDSCAALGLQLVFCSPADDNPDDCPPVSCDCGGTQLSFGLGCTSDRCLTAISCDAVCAPDTDAQTRAFLCLFNGVCKGDADCEDGGRCLVNPGDTSGECSSREVGAACFENADCLSGACVVAADGSRSCTSGLGGMNCNRDEQCVGDLHCALAAGAFAGLCTDGREPSPCATDKDCQTLLTCVTIGTAQICSAKSPGSPCATDGNCDGNFCVSSKCASGAAGAPCTTASQCRVPLCTSAQVCSEGAPGDACHVDADCRDACVAGTDGIAATCSDGDLGSACRREDGTPCAAGLHCAASGASFTCTGPAPVGAVCAKPTDCQSQKCGGLPGAPGAVCTEGLRGQRCHADDCVAGLHCVSDGLAGVCVAGVAGDPCHAPQDCLGGACLPVPAPPMIGCFGVPDFGACGARGVCINGDCFPQTCGPAGDGGASDTGD
jgi:hypothetical protein